MHIVKLKCIFPLLLMCALLLFVSDVSQASAASNPILESSSGGSHKIILTYDKILNSNIVPLASDFHVTNGGNEVAVDSVQINGKDIILNFQNSMWNRQATVDYLPGENPVQDMEGNKADAFTGLVVDLDVIPPYLVSYQTGNGFINLVFSEVLDESSVPSAGSFEVSVNQTAIDIKQINISDNILAIHVNEDLTLVKDITVDFLQDLESPAQDLMGNSADYYVNLQLNPTKIICQYASIYGSYVYIDFNTLLNTIVIPPTTDFTVTIDNNSTTITNVYVNENSVILQLAESVNSGQAVKVCYAPGNNPLQDIKGLWAGSLNNYLVVNDVKGADTKLQSDLTINNDYDLNIYGTYDLNGHTLTINGNLIHRSGTLLINGGRLIINGDYRLQDYVPFSSTGDIEYSDSRGSLQMADSLDYMLVNGSFYARGDDSLSAGVLEIKGNVSGSFSSKSYHIVVLSGSNNQIIDNEGYFNYLEFQNTALPNLTLLSPLNLKRPLQLGTDLTLAAPDSFQFTGELDLNGHTLTINGDFIHDKGELRLNGGRLIVNGDYKVQFNPYFYYGKLTADNPDDYILVNGNFCCQSSGITISAGVLEVKGDFKQLGYSNICTDFKASGTNKVILSGSGTQTVSFDAAGPLHSYFNYLQIDNTSVPGVIFTTPFTIKQPLQQDLTFHQADVNITGNFDMNGHTIVAKGNLTNTHGYIILNGGKLIVNGNYSTDGLAMDNAKDYVLVMGNFLGKEHGALSAGILEVKGDYYQEDRGSFWSGGTHETIFSGTGKQAIHSDDAFNILRIPNCAQREIIFQSGLSLNTPLAQDLQITIPDEVTNDFTIYSDLDLNGHTFIVKGNLRQTDHNLNVNGGKLYIYGKYELAWDGNLVMNNSSDYVMAGSFDLYKDISWSTGTLEVTGDLNISYCNFRPTGTQRIILSGNKNQTVSMINPGLIDNSPYSSSCFNILEVKNPNQREILFHSDLAVRQPLVCDLSLSFADGCALGGDLNLNGYSLTINSDFVQDDHNMFINGGRLDVKGSYTLEKLGTINMSNVKDYVLVNGNFIVSSEYYSYYDRRNILSAGTMEIKGDFHQINPYSQFYNPYNKLNFCASGTHKVILSGNSLQTVEFDSPGLHSSHIMGLELRNTNVIFIPSLIAIVYDLIKEEEQLKTVFRDPVIIGARDYRAADRRSFIEDPIDSATGAHVLQYPLLSLNSPQEFIFNAEYNSLLLNEGPMGKGWGHNFETRLVADTSGEAVICWTANRQNKFVDNGNGEFSSTDLAVRLDKLYRSNDGTYTLYRDNGNTYFFNSTGLLCCRQDKHGRPIDLSYNNNQLVQVTDRITQHSINLEYNSEGLICKVYDNLNRSVQFAYDANHGLVGITDAAGNIFNYSYDSNGRVLSGRQNGKQVFKDTYDVQGRVSSQDDALEGNELTLFHYDDSLNDQITTVATNRNGKTKVLMHDKNFRLLSIRDELDNTISYTYDDNGNRLSATDPKENTSSCTYDEHGNKLTSTDPAENTTTYTYDKRNNLLSITRPGSKTTSMTYDERNNLLSSVDPAGNITSYTYDENSQLLTKTISGQGTTTYAYENGLLKTVTDPTGVSTSFEYDAVGRVTSLTDGGGNTTSITYDTMDNPLTITDPLGHTITNAYDARGHLLTQTDPNGNTAHYTYNDNGKMIRKTDALGNVTAYDYDGEDRLIKITDAEGHTTVYTYDAAGQLIETTNSLGNTVKNQYDANGNALAIVDAKGNRILSNTFDNLNQVVAYSDALGRTTVQEYDVLGNLSKIIDPKKRESIYSYDPISRLISAKDPLSGISAQTFATYGNILNITDPDNNQRIFTYDQAGRLVSQKDAGGNIATITYNNLGLEEIYTNAREQQTCFQYDRAGRLTAMTTPEGPINYTYDKNGNLLTLTDNSGTISRTYDALNRVTSYTDAQGNSIGYQYDAVGNLIKLTYPDGKKVNYEYDAANRLTTVTDWAARVTTYQYDVNDRLVATVRPDGSILTLTYDDAGQLLQQEDTDKNGSIIGQYDFTYDETGNILSEISNLSSPSIKARTNTMSYGLDNRLTDYNGEQVNYDADGNMIFGPLNGGMDTFVYDSRNRLIQAGETQYSYDAENNRVAINNSNGQTQFVVNPEAVLSQILIRQQEGQQTFYVYGLGLIGEETDGIYSVYHYDRRGSTVVISDLDGMVTDRYYYEPYGQLIAHNGSKDTPFLYNGRDGVMSDDDGLYYMRARYYNPEIKRFINQDILPGNIAQGQSLNRYAYVNGQPIRLVDPFGLDPRIDVVLYGWDTYMEAGGMYSKFGNTYEAVGDAGYIYKTSQRQDLSTSKKILKSIIILTKSGLSYFIGFSIGAATSGTGVLGFVAAAYLTHEVSKNMEEMMNWAFREFGLK